MGRGRRGGRAYEPVVTPEQSGNEEAQKAIAKADALATETQRRKAVVLQRAQMAPFGKWGTSLDKDTRQAYDRSPDAFGSQTSPWARDQSLPNETAAEGRRRVATQREQAFTGFFGKRAQVNPVSSAGPVGPTVTTTPSGGGSAGPATTTTYGQYGGGTTRQVKANELVQPYFADNTGDVTHTVLPKTPGEDPNLDPVYAANVFRNAGDPKTAAAYEKFASTMDPSKFTGPNGAPWQNPHFGAPAATVAAPQATSPAAPKAATSPLDILTPPAPANFQASLGAAPEETFAGKPLSAVSDTSTNAPVFPSREFLAGKTFREGVSNAFSLTPGSPTSRGAPPAVTPIGKPLFDLPSFVAGAGGGEASPGYRFGSAGRAPGTPDNPVFSSKDFFRGASTPAGVSRATVADFGQPTKDNPVPTTPTTPPAAPEQSAIAGFGGLNTPLQPPPAQPPPEKKYAFAGF